MPATALPVRLPLQLSVKERSEYVTIASTVLHQTLELYKQHLETPTPLDPSLWKLLKRRERTAVYASRDKNHHTAFHDPDTFPDPTPLQRMALWKPQSKLRCIGSLLGTLEDALYGAATPTETAMVIRSLTIQDEFVEHQTLCDISVPTEDEPFTYVGIKWSARSAYLATMIRPRDMTYVESTGITSITRDGKTEQIGYCIYHSVDLPQLPPLTEMGTRRSRFSLAILIRQAEPGEVEVFSTIATMAAGDLPRKLTTMFSCEALISAHKYTENAMKKKLRWMRAARIYGPEVVGNVLTESTPRRRRDSFFVRTTISTCPQCTRELSSLRADATCYVCDTSVCSRCITPKRLVLGRTKSELKYESVDVCKGCLTTAMRMEYARELAIYEFVRPFQSSKRRPSLKFLDSTNDGQSHSHSTDEGTVDELASPYSPIEESVREYPVLEASDRFSDERLELWNRMNNLRLQAEQTYRFTVEQSRAIQTHRMD